MKWTPQKNISQPLSALVSNLSKDNQFYYKYCYVTNIILKALKALHIELIMHPHHINTGGRELHV